MKKIGNVWIADGRRFSLAEEELLRTCCVIRLLVNANPQITWKGREDMIDRINNDNETLLGLGILNQEALTWLKENRTSSVDIAAEFENLDIAKSVFYKNLNLDEGTVIDIYLYYNGEMVDKYD